MHPDMIRSFIKRIQAHGALGTIAATISYGRNLHRRWIDTSLDRKYGTRTDGIIDDMTELGVFGQHRIYAQGYEGIQIPVFQKLLRDLPVAPLEYTFVDFGSGKGRALMMAAEHHFAKVVGVEFSPVLHSIAAKNIEAFQQRRPKCAPIQLHLQDAADFPIPDGKLVGFFYNPFDRPVMEKVAANLAASYAQSRRKIIVAYRNPVYADLFDSLEFLTLIKTTPDYYLYESV